MNDIGLGLGTGVDAFARGMEFGERWKSRKDEAAWNEELKARQRSDWKAADDLLAKQNLTNQIRAFYEAQQSGIDVDPAPMLQAMSNAGQFGASLAQHFVEPEKMQTWLNVAERTLETGEGSPMALAALNWRLRDQIHPGITTIDKPMQTDAGEIPAGSKIIDRRIAQVLPSAKKDRSGKVVPTNDGMFFGLEVDVETPDGKRLTYPAPMTVGRDTNPDAQILSVPMTSIFDLVKADRLIMDDIQSDPKFAGAMRAVLASLGSPVAAEKFETVKIDEGNESVTYEVDSRGNRKKIASAPRWQPEQPNKPSADWGDYQRAKTEGFQGTFVDFKQALKGQGFSVEQPDGTVITMGGPAGGGKAPTGYRWKADGSALEPIPGGPEDPNTPKRPGAEVQRMNIAIEALDGGLQAYEDLLDRFNVRSLDQLDQTQRAEAASLVADLRLQFKEAQALGALTGPDISVLDQLLSDPTSGKAMIFGNEGLRAQLQQARQSVARRKAATDKVTGAAPQQATPYREGQTATNPKTGERVVYRGGKWEPAQ